MLSSMVTMLCMLSRLARLGYASSRSTALQVAIQGLPRRHLCSARESLSSLFQHQIDNYGAVHYKDPLAPVKLRAAEFEQLVQQEIEHIVKEGKIRSVWFRISTENVHLVEPLVKLGFEFHHTKHNYVVLVRALSQSNSIPKYAYTNIGVGALVVDEHSRILAVKEKHFYVRQMWKFPGGYVEQGEELHNAVEREVFEETGVESRFEGVLLMRHLHKFSFDCSDLYFVCLCTPLTKEISNCDREIEHCQWWPMEDVRELMSPFNRFAIDKFREWRNSSICIAPQTLDPYFASMPPYTVYSMNNSPTNTETGQ